MTIRSMPSNAAFRENFDRVFSSKPTKDGHPDCFCIAPEDCIGKPCPECRAHKEWSARREGVQAFPDTTCAFCRHLEDVTRISLCRQRPTAVMVSPAQRACPQFEARGSES